MAKYAIEDTTLAAIANATRKLTGTTGLLTPEQMASKIQADADSGKTTIETCTVTLQTLCNSMQDHVIALCYLNKNLECVDLFDVSIPNTPTMSLTVVKNSILYWEMAGSTILAGYSGSIDEFDTNTSEHSAFIIRGNCTLKFDED